MSRRQPFVIYQFQITVYQFWFAGMEFLLVFHCIQGCFNLVRKPDVVLVAEHHVPGMFIQFCHPEQRGKIGTGAVLTRYIGIYYDIGMFYLIRLEYLYRAVSRIIIAYPKLPIRVSLRKQAVQLLLQVSPAIVSGHQDMYQGLCHSGILLIPNRKRPVKFSLIYSPLTGDIPGKTFLAECRRSL